MTQRVVIADDGQPRFVLAAAPIDGQLVSIDYLSFTVDEAVALLYVPGGVADKDVEIGAVQIATDLLGYKISSIRDVSPQGYRRGKQLDDVVVVGTAGSGNRIYFAFSGGAFLHADSNFNQRLYDFMKSQRTARITRVDLAFDDFTGSIFTPQQIYQDWHAGLFDVAKGNSPKVSLVGDYERGDPYKKGVSIYVGSRPGGKMLRGYEKDKQLGNRDGKWVRVEVEFRNNCFVILEDVLINPTGFFVGAYPYLAAKLACVTVDVSASKFERVCREGIDDIERIVRVIKEQYGRYIKVLRKEFFESDAELLDLIQSDDDVIPKALVKALQLHSTAEALARPLETV